jgi:rhodanese-related sulfurtransferase
MKAAGTLCAMNTAPHPTPFAPSVRTPRAAPCRQVLLAVMLALAAGVATAAPAQALDLAQARAELAAGVLVWDLRSAGPVLPGAVRVQPDALAAWREHGDAATLSAAVSAAGVNLSGRVLVVADADDADTAALAERLAALSRGSVAWLRGGLPAWQQAGLPLQAQPSTRLPMPQRLVALPAGEGATLPADGARRRTATFALYEPLPQVSQAGGSAADRAR